MTGVALLKGSVKHYDWGGKNFIPALLNIANNEGRPFAEYWMGVHPQAECNVIIDNKTIPLNDFLSQDIPSLIGQYVHKNFGTIPYLLKVLDVKDMLSIQVHPAKQAAQFDFERENKSGIALDSPSRNYKDANHKPELMVAMGEFWLLHGFKPEEELAKILSSVPELNSHLPIFSERGYSELYRSVMEMPQDDVNKKLQPLLTRILPLYKSNQLDKSSPDYWAAKAAITFAQPGRIDRGIFSIYLFNLVRLTRGEAIFQDAGVPHAYLEGQNVEIMASSDNVLRGGLTSKNIDVKELLRHVKCEATHPKVLTGTSVVGERVYKTIAPDFELGSYELEAGAEASFRSSTAEILLLINGSIEISGNNESAVLKKGEPSAITFAGNDIKLKATEKSLIFRATVPAKEVSTR